jgi:hypothetical protein
MSGINLILLTTFGSHYCYPHLKDEETETQKGLKLFNISQLTNKRIRSWTRHSGPIPMHSTSIFLFSSKLAPKVVISQILIPSALPLILWVSVKLIPGTWDYLSLNLSHLHLYLSISTSLYFYSWSWFKLDYFCLKLKKSTT